MSRDFDNNDDVLDVRDIIERIEELENGRDKFQEENKLPDLDLTEKYDSPEYDKFFGKMSQKKIQKLLKKWDEWENLTEFKNLVNFLSDFCGYGGDEQWRGDRYPGTLVRDSYWVDFCKEEVEDLGYIAKDFPWWIEIDWEQTSENMKQDYYTSGEFDGVTYWGR